MSRSVKSVGWSLVAAVVVGILALGAREAFAASSTMSCPNDGWNTMGFQSSWQNCWNACVAVHPDLAQANWNPVTGCCSCLF